MDEKIDPLRRIWVPIEKRNTDGSWGFRTTDGERYRRDENGVIRSIAKKVNGKIARKERQRVRSKNNVAS